MMDAANDVVIENLRDGRKVEIRALRSEDRLLAAIRRSGRKSIFQREEIDFSVTVDFVNHVASEISGALTAGGEAYVGGMVELGRTRGGLGREVISEASQHLRATLLKRDNAD